jgi:ABC-type thiamin/hydroxymethylpyrimidine transport system permease subunit
VSDRAVRLMPDRWSPREFVLAVVLGAAGGGVVAGWDALRPALDRFGLTGLTAVLDGTLVLPALLPALFVRRPGTVLVGLVAGQLFRLVAAGRIGAGTLNFPFEAVLQMPLVAVAPEVWLRARGENRGGITLTVAGALTGAASVAVARVVTPSAYPAGAWWGAALSLALAGAVAGAVTGYARDTVAARLAGRQRP